MKGGRRGRGGGSKEREKTKSDELDANEKIDPGIVRSGEDSPVELCFDT